MPLRSRHRPAAAVLTAAALFSCVPGEPAAPKPAEAPAEPAPMSVVDAAGARAQVAELAGRGPVVVNFWATWCQPCMAELPEFAEAARSHPGVRFVGVNADWTASGEEESLEANKAKAEAAWRRLGMPFPSLYWDGYDINDLADAFVLETGVLPQTLLYVGGNQVGHHAGEMSLEELEALLDSAAE